MAQHHYTVAQANAMLPQLTEVLQELRTAAQQLAALQGKVQDTKKKVRGNGYHNPAEDALVSEFARRLEESVRRGLAQLASWNIQLKDMATGLVDFPAQRAGRTVYLCWRLGEDEVGYWHETTTGFDSRQPLDDNTL